MKLTTDTITVINRQLDESSGKDVYIGTVIRGVSWYSTTAAAVDDKGLHAANTVTIRIPDDAYFSGKSYVDPMAYREADPAEAFTLENGDTIVRGVVDTIITRPADLHEQYAETVTILGVTDNRRAPRAKHWRVTCG